jgi:hypothetical protein
VSLVIDIRRTTHNFSRLFFRILHGKRFLFNDVLWWKSEVEDVLILKLLGRYYGKSIAELECQDVA